MAVLRRDVFGVTSREYTLPDITAELVRNGYRCRVGYVYQNGDVTVRCTGDDKFAGAGHESGDSTTDVISRHGDVHVYEADKKRNRWIVSFQRHPSSAGTVTLPPEVTNISGKLTKDFISSNARWFEFARLDPDIGTVSIEIENFNKCVFSIVGAIMGPSRSCKFFLNQAATTDVKFPYESIRFVAVPNQESADYYSVQLSEHTDSLPVGAESNGLISIEGYGHANQGKTQIINPVRDPAAGVQVQVLNFFEAVRAGEKNIRELNNVAVYAKRPTLERQLATKGYVDDEIIRSVEETVEEVFERYRSYYIGPLVPHDQQFTNGNHHDIFRVTNIPEWVKRKRIRVGVNVTIQTQEEGAHAFWLRVAGNQSEVRGSFVSYRIEGSNRGHIVAHMDWSLVTEDAFNIQLRIDKEGSQWWSLQNGPRNGYSKLYIDAVLIAEVTLTDE